MSDLQGCKDFNLKMKLTRIDKANIKPHKLTIVPFSGISLLRQADGIHIIIVTVYKFYMNL